MRVAMIDPSLFTWPYDVALARALRRCGHEVTIYGSASRLPRDAGDDASLLCDHFYRHAAVAEAPAAGSRLLAKGFDHLGSMAALASRLRHDAPDLIHFQWTPLPVVDRMFLPRLKTMAPVVLTVHDTAPFNGNPRLRIQRWGAFGIMRHFDHLIVHTHCGRERVAAHGLDRSWISVLPHGPLGTKPDVTVRPQNRDDPGTVRLLLFGKLKPYKGLDILLRALAALPASLQHRWCLQVVGQPQMDLQPALDFAQTAGIARQIEFDFRFIDERDIAGVLAGADLMVLPYREIDASGVLMMALASGLPVVASRIGLFAELLEDGCHGRLVPPEDVGALATALTELIGSAPLRRQMSGRVRLLHAALPGWDEIARRTQDIYSALITAHRIERPFRNSA